ncbi:hypothetical protein X801_09690, partial [Opisthorchis viverrini]
MLPLTAFLITSLLVLSHVNLASTARFTDQLGFESPQKDLLDYEGNFDNIKDISSKPRWWRGANSQQSETRYAARRRRFFCNPMGCVPT